MNDYWPPIPAIANRKFQVFLYLCSHYFGKKACRIKRFLLFTKYAYPDYFISFIFQYHIHSAKLATCTHY